MIFGYTKTKILETTLVSALTTLCTQPAFATDKPQGTLQEVFVTADFYSSTALDFTSSVTVLGEESIKQTQAQHLEQLLALVPNVNYATGASRGRFIQIRGIGERSEFIEPVNYSVGVLIDGIDFTGISTAATTLDIQQVEVLRGPQGTLYGANALAGLINIVTNGPSENTEGNAQVTAGNYDSYAVSAAVGGSLSDSVGYRLAGKTYQSDGYIDNTYLNADDTNNFDETALRGKLSIEATSTLDLGLTVFYADIDNGYDVFNYESLRQTRSNEPGHDRQETVAAAISSDWKIDDSVSMEVNISHANSDIEYGFDEDWRNPEFCIVETCTFGPDGYHTAFDNYRRDNRNTSIDLRLVSSQPAQASNWVIGLYHRNQDNDLDKTYTYDGFPTVFSSEYNTKNTAIYGDWSYPLTDLLIVNIGGRVEARDARYRDSDAFGFSTDETLWGAKASLSYRVNDQQTIYGTISHGYKPGGANSNSAIPEAFREYDTETMINYEIGLKGMYLENALQTQIAVFYQDRRDIQTDSAIVDCTSLPCSFDDYLANAATGNNYGLEAQIVYSASGMLEYYASIGLLETEYGNYINFQHIRADESSGTGFNMSGREQPHAPSYQFVVGVNLAPAETILINVNLEGKDDFLFSNDHDVQSAPYTLANASVDYLVDGWTLTVWGKNLLDKDYQNRAFGTFGNDPRNGYSSNGPYFQQGDPRTYGFTANYSF